MKLPLTESDSVEGLPCKEEELGCPARFEFRGRLHDEGQDRWVTGWKPAFETWEAHAPSFTDQSDCMLGGISVGISSRWESDVMEEFLAEAAERHSIKMDAFRHIAAKQLSGGRRVEMLSDIQEAITASRSILELEDDWDDQGSPGYSETTWRRASEFLLRQANLARMSLDRELPVPKILPGPNASIDLHWKLAGFELLVNIPSDGAQPATFYGDDYRNSCIRGNLNTSEEIRGLVVWLLT